MVSFAMVVTWRKKRHVAGECYWVVPRPVQWRSLQNLRISGKKFESECPEKPVKRTYSNLVVASRQPTEQCMSRHDDVCDWQCMLVHDGMSGCMTRRGSAQGVVLASPVRPPAQEQAHVS
eukprot:328052-Chlamydomonas_euryale.AAC.3